MTSSASAAAPSQQRASTWQAIPAADGDAVARARREALNIVQWVARIANSYVRHEADERTLLEFRSSNAAFVTKTFENNKAIEMRLPTLELQFLENGKPVAHIFDPEEHSPAETEAWVLVELLHRGIDRDKFSMTLPYSMPALMTGDADDYSPRSCEEGLAHLTAWYRNAETALGAASGGGAKAIVCSPQTLNLTRSQIGFSPGDKRLGEPYFYKGANNSEKFSTLSASQLASERDPLAAAIAFLSDPAG